MREDFPELRGFAHLGANNEYGSEIFDVKFFPYTQPRVDPVFAAAGDHEVYICRPLCRDKKVIEVLRVYRDKEVRPGCVFNSVVWTKAERPQNSVRPQHHEDAGEPQCVANCLDRCTCKAAPSPRQENEIIPLLCIAGQIPKIKVLNIITGQVERTFVGHGRAINDLAISPIDHNLLASCSGDSTIRLWNLREEFAEAPCVGLLAGNHHEKDILTIDFHSSGRYLLAGGMDLKVTLWIIPDLPETPSTPQDPAFVMHPHFASRDIHVDMVDCVKFYGNNIISRSAKSCQIIIWSIVGFDEYVDVYDKHTHSCTYGNDAGKIHTGDSVSAECRECQSCPICNLQAPPPLSMDLSTSSAFNLNPRAGHSDSTIGLQGETGVQILLVLDLPHSNLFYMRFGLFEPVLESEQTKRQIQNNRSGQHENDSQTGPASVSSTPNILPNSAPNSRNRNRKGGKRPTKGLIEAPPKYSHAMLCAGNERSRFFFWDLDALETAKPGAVTAPGGPLTAGVKRKRAKQPNSNPVVSSSSAVDDSSNTSFSTLRTLRAARAHRAIGPLTEGINMARTYKDRAHPLSVTTSSIHDFPLESTPRVDTASRGSGTPLPQTHLHSSFAGKSSLGLTGPDVGIEPSSCVEADCSSVIAPSGSVRDDGRTNSIATTSSSIQFVPVLTTVSKCPSSLTDHSIRVEPCSITEAQNLVSLSTPDLTVATMSLDSSTSSSALSATVVAKSNSAPGVHHSNPYPKHSSAPAAAPGVASGPASSVSPALPIQKLTGSLGNRQGGTSSSTTTTTTNPQHTPNLPLGGTTPAAPSPTFQSAISDPAVLLQSHRTQTVSKINFTIRQVAWSVGGEWCVGCGDAGMLAVFGRV